MNVCRPSRKPTQHFSGSKLDKLNFGGASNKPSLKHPGTTPLGRYHGMRGKVWRVPGSIVCHRTKSYHVYGIGFTEDIWPNQGQREREVFWTHCAKQTQRNRKTMKNLQIVLTCPNHDCSSDTSTMSVSLTCIPSLSKRLQLVQAP